MAGAASPAVTLVEPIEPSIATSSDTALPGMISDGRERTDVHLRNAGTADAGPPNGPAEPVVNAGATAVLPRNGQPKISQNFPNGKKKNWFWRYWSKIEQQEISSSSLPLMVFCRPAQGASSGCCAVLFAVLSGILLSTAGSFEETVVPYSHMHSSKVFTIDADIEGPVMIWYEIPDLLLNHKYAVKSKDHYLWSGFMNKYACEDDSASTLQDANWRRPNSPQFAQLLASGGVQKFRPCGLVALAMYIDTFNIYSRGSRVILDVTDLTLDTDNDIYEKKFSPRSGGYQMDGVDSWLTSAWALERFKVWYRTPASPVVRQLYARVAGGLPSGEYSLNFTVNDPVFELKWSVPEKRIIFSTSKNLGSVGACRSLGIFCILIAILETSAFGLFLVSPWLGRSKTVPSSAPLTASAASEGCEKT